MKETYKDIVIEYREKQNDWLFLLRGVERTASSLTLAKEAIDKPPSVKDKTFTRTPCWFESRWEAGWVEVEVTSIVAPRPHELEPCDCWVVHDGNRSKETMRYLFPKNPHNDALMVKIMDLCAQIKALAEEKNKLTKQLKTLADQVRSK